MKNPAAEHWQKSRRMSYILIAIWFSLTLGSAWYAEELNEIALLDFPLGFYLEAQGLPIIFLAMIWFYNRYMNRLDRQYSVSDD